MAEVIANVAATQKQSIARVELFTDANKNPDDWELVVHFEDGLYDQNGQLLQQLRFGSRTVRRRYGDIKNMVVSGGITVAQLAGLISVAAYALRAEDIAAEE
jgi:hypothetical protein